MPSVFPPTMTTPAVAPAPTRNVWPGCFLVLAALPLFFINIRPDQDWGDDFAMFIAHATNLVEGRPYAETGYVYDPSVTCFGPGVYPPGFPLLLAPVFALAGTSIVSAQYLITFCFFVSGLAAFVLFRSRTRAWIAASMVLVLWYHPWALAYKARILSDIPFAMWLLLTWNALHSKHPRVQACLWILLPMLVLTRTVGWTVPMAMFAFALMHGPVHRFFRTIRMPAPPLYGKPLLWVGLILWTVACRVGVYALLDVQAAGSYADNLALSDPLGILLANLDEYLEQFFQFFPPIQSFDFPGRLLAAIALAFAVLGILGRIRRLGCLELMLGIHMLILLAWPCPQGFRFLFPLVPFAFLYLLDGFRWLGRGEWPSALFFLSFLALNLLAGPTAAQREAVPCSGPFQPEALEMFQAVRTITEPDAQVDF